MRDYMPGAVQDPQPGGVTLDTSLPPRFVWHITWDALDANGNQPAFSAVAGYLKGKEWCPHIMWDPFTGYMEQYYPASVGARALTCNDQDGAACVQVEIFFTPGCVVDGIKYQTVADTPLKGWAELLAWADSLGVPRVWPMGAPQWQGNPRDVGIWNGNAGHYGHCNSPGDTHTDPGPMPSLGITLQSESITPQEDDLTPEERATLFSVLDKINANVAALPQPQYWNDLINAVARVDGSVPNIPAAVLNQTFPLGDGTYPNLAGILSAIYAKPAAVTNVTSASIDVDALVARLKAELPAAQFEYFKTQITK